MNEKEIQLQLKHKLEAILSHIHARVCTNWIAAAHTGQPKYNHYWEAFKELEGVFLNVIRMPLPSNNMAEEEMRKRRDRAVDQLIETLDLRGRGDYRKINSVVSIVEDLLIN